MHFDMTGPRKYFKIPNLDHVGGFLGHMCYVYPYGRRRRRFFFLRSSPTTTPLVRDDLLVRDLLFPLAPKVLKFLLGGVFKANLAHFSGQGDAF